METESRQRGKCAAGDQGGGGIDVPIERLHLGIISEAAFEGRGHWLLFYYRVLGAVWVEPHDIGRAGLEWFAEEIGALPLPETDREIIWPLILRNERSRGGGPGFFAVHIDCSPGPDGKPGLKWTVEQEW